MSPGPELRISDDPDERCAESIARRLRAAVASRQLASLALSGGSSAPPMFARLAAKSVPWDRVAIWQVDERVAPDGHPDRNANQLDALPAARHTMPVTAEDLPAAAERYASSLPDRFDVIHLGMGDDGHTASWPPGDPVADEDAPVALSEPYQGRVRMTLTPQVVNAGRCRLVLCTGAAKAVALAEWIERRGTVPIARLRSSGTVVFTDRDATSALGGRVRR